MKIEIVFMCGITRVNVVTGIKDVQKETLTLKELELLVTVVPQLLEKVTGLRVHINEV